MPRYYMHICDGTGFVEDEEGVELLDDATARRKATEAARDVMANDLRAGELDFSSFIEVENENRQLLFTVQFTDAVKLTRRQTEADRPR